MSAKTGDFSKAIEAMEKKLNPMKGVLIEEQDILVESKNMPRYKKSDFTVTTKDPQNSGFCDPLKGVLIEGQATLVESENMPRFEESDFTVTTKDPQTSDFCNQLKGVLIQGLDILVQSEI